MRSNVREMPFLKHRQIKYSYEVTDYKYDLIFLTRCLLKIITKLYKIILIVLQYLNFFHFVGSWGPGTTPPGGDDPMDPKNPKCETASHHLFLIFLKQLLSEIVCTFFLSIHWFRILLISASFLILSDISGLLQESSANYMFLNSISQLLTLNPNNH